MDTIREWVDWIQLSIDSCTWDLWVKRWLLECLLVGTSKYLLWGLSRSDLDLKNICKIPNLRLGDIFVILLNKGSSWLLNLFVLLPNIYGFIQIYCYLVSRDLVSLYVFIVTINRVRNRDIVFRSHGYSFSNKNQMLVTIISAFHSMI